MPNGRASCKCVESAAVTNELLYQASLEQNVQPFEPAGTLQARMTMFWILQFRGVPERRVVVVQTVFA
jgi:hypothetical protein